MLKKLMTNKKLLIGLTIIAVGATIVFSGITGAWWNIEPTSINDPLNFTMGELNVSVGLINDSGLDETKVYEPGKPENLNISILIENTGSIDAFVKLNFDEFINVEENVSLDVNPLYLNPVYLDGKNIDPAYAAELAENITVHEGSYCLFMDNENNYYFALYGSGTKITLDNCITAVEFIGGDKTSSVYDDAEIGMRNADMNKNINIDISLNWEATQVIDEAILAKFGVDVADDTEMHIITFG